MTSGRYFPPPQGTWRRRYYEFLIFLTYDVWRRQILQFSHRSPDGTFQVLECGCGPGFLARFLERWFSNAEVVGLDINQGLIQVARGQTARTKFVQAVSEGIPFAASKFDIVIALHMIEHLRTPHLFITEARRVLIPGGLLIIATPNPAGIGARIMGQQWSGWNDETHIALNPPVFWQSLIESSGFAILEDGTTGLSGIPIFRKLPFALLNWGPLFLFGFFPWAYGEAYICIATPL